MPNLDTHLTWTVDTLGLVISDLSNRLSLCLDYFLKFAYPVDEIEVVNSANSIFCYMKSHYSAQLHTREE